MRHSCTLILLSGILTGCSVYQWYAPLPLEPVVLAEATGPDNMPQIEDQSSRVAHPLLRAGRVTFGDGLTPDEAAVVAVIANPELRVLRHECGFARAQLIEAWTLPNPEATAEIEFPVGSDGGDKVTGFTIGVDWEVTSVLPLWANVTAARRHEAAVALHIAWQEWLVAQKARQQAYRVAAVRAQVAAARAIERGLNDGLARMKEAVQSGARTDIDLASAEAAWLQAHSACLDTEQDLLDASLELNHMLGSPTNNTAVVAMNVLFPTVPSNLIASAAALIRGLETNRLDLRALQKEFEGQESRYRAALIGQVPKTSVGVFGGRDLEDVSSMGVGVTMDIPLFDRNQAEVVREKTARAQLRDDYHARVAASRAEVMRLVSTIQTIDRKIAALEQSVATHSRLVDSYQFVFDKGAVDVFALFESRNRLAENQRELLGLHASLAAALIDLETACGTSVIVSSSPLETQL